MGAWTDGGWMTADLCQWTDDRIDGIDGQTDGADGGTVGGFMTGRMGG